MGFHHFRYFRGLVLGLMFFLAGTAFCSSDAYDPDPYDNVPPVVTVEFSYLIPGQASVRVSPSAFRDHGKILRAARGPLAQPLYPLSATKKQIIFAALQEPPPTFLPLRR